MQIYPALDLYDGQCVRLAQGNFQQRTLYANDPLQQAQDFLAQGAGWLHLVDLSAAKNPQQPQLELIRNLVTQLTVKVQLGGGIRTAEQIERWLQVGVARVIIGSQAVLNPQTVIDWLTVFGADQLVLALDCQLDPQGQAYVAYNGWQNQSTIALERILDRFQTAGIRHVLCTDIRHDGMLNGPNQTLYQTLRQRYPDIQWQASGGIRDLTDIKQLEQLNLAGVIIGKALYAKKFSLAQAIAAVA